MKTIEEFLKEVAASKELQDELKAIESKDTLAAFLKKNNCGATVEEFAEFIKSNTEGEISDSNAESAAGGLPCLNPAYYMDIKKNWIM